MIRVGDVNQFALECEVSDKNSSEGSIFIVIKNNRYGSKSGEFNLKDFFNNIKTPLESFNPFIPVLYDYGATEIFKSLDAVWEDTTIDDCPIEASVPGFFDDPTDVTHRIIFYGGDYAFDGISIILISNGKKVHLIVRDNDELRMSDIIIDSVDFKNKFFELSKEYQRAI